MNRYIHIILIFLLGCYAYGQDDSHMSFSRYGIEDGLPNLTMNVLGQDSIGYIWLANPLTRFDGKIFKTYRETQGLASSSLISAVSMTDDGQGNLFFASQEGVYYFDTLQQYVRKIPSIPYNSSSRKILKTDSVTFWDLSRNNLYKIELPNFDTTRIKVPEIENTQYILNTIEDSKIWFIDKQNKLVQLDLNTFKTHTYKTDETKDLGRAYFVKGIDKRIWLVTHQELMYFDKTKNEFVDFLKYDQVFKDKKWSFKYSTLLLGQNCWWIIDRLNYIVYRYDLITYQLSSTKTVHSIEYNFKLYNSHNAIETTDGGLVLGTTKEGLFTINPQNGNINQYLSEPNNTNSLYNNSTIPEYKIDKNSFLISGVGQGIIKADFQKPIFETFISTLSNSNNAYANNIRTLVEWKEDIIVGSITSINIFDKKDKTFRPLLMPGDLPSPHPENGAVAIASDNAQNLLITYWVQSEEAEIFYLDYTNNKILDLTDSFPETSFSASNALLTDSQNNFWLSMQSGVIRISADLLANGNLKNIRDQATFYSFKKWRRSEKDVHKIFTIAEGSKGQIWVGTSAGLFKINQETNKIDVFKNSIDDNNSLSSNDIRSIITSSFGDIWVGTSNGGLNKYIEKSNSFERYTTNEGLPDNTIYTIAQDEENKLWLGTNKGLCWFDTQTLQSQQYMPDEGVQSYEFNTNAVCKTKDNLLLFGGINGFNMFSPKEISTYASSKNLVLTSIKVNNQNYPITNSFINLAHDENFISFEFKLLDFYKNDKIQYAYKLEGLENDWNYLKSAQKVTYPGLNSGDYTFKVKAASYNGSWSKKTISMPLSIASPWWHSWWFVLLSSSLIVGIVYALYRNSQNQKEKIIELRSRISRDLHDEIGSTLSSISLFGTVAQKMADTDSNATQNMLLRINESTTQVMESMNDIVWAINSDNDKIDNLLMRMRAYISELSDATEVKVSLAVDENIKQVALHMVQRRNVYLIFKEATNNAFKYANASEIKISLSQKKNKFQLSVIDNGIGFDQSTNRKNSLLSGNGLKNMAIRAKELGGNLSVISEVNKGTEIRFIWNPKTEPTVTQNK